MPFSVFTSTKVRASIVNGEKPRSEEFHFDGSVILDSHQFDFVWVTTLGKIQTLQGQIRKFRKTHETHKISKF